MKLEDLINAGKVLDRLLDAESVRIADHHHELCEMNLIDINTFGYEISEKDYKSLQPFLYAKKEEFLGFDDYEHHKEGPAVIQYSIHIGGDNYIIPFYGKIELQNLRGHIAEMIFLMRQEEKTE